MVSSTSASLEAPSLAATGGFPSCTTPSANLSASRARQGAASTSIPAWSTRRRNQTLVAVVSIACSGIVPAIVEEWIQSCFVP